MPVLPAFALWAVAAAVAAGPPVDPAAWMGVAGATAERVDEPVFDGTVMLYHAGARGAEPVVLVHGLGQNGARDWNKLVPALAQRYEVFTLDLPGFGESAKGNQEYSPDNYIRLIEKVLAPRVARPFALIGHSMGGAIALGYAGAHPARVKRLILVDMAGVLQGAVYADYLARGGVERATGYWPGGGWFDSMLRGALTRMDGVPFDRELLLRTPALRQKMFRGDPNAIAAFALGEHDFSEALRSVRAPTLVIWGRDDRIAPLRTGQMAASLIPGARLAVLDGVEHVPMQQDPARFNALVLDELAGRSTLAPFAVAHSGPPGGAAASCDGKEGLRYSGDFTTLTLIQCRDIEVSHARIGELRVLESDVRLVDSEIRGGIYALRSQVELTGGSVAGAPPLKLEASNVDAAGTRFDAADAVAANLGQAPLTLRLSVAEVRRAGKLPRYVHALQGIPAASAW